MDSNYIWNNTASLSVDERKIYKKKYFLFKKRKNYNHNKNHTEAFPAFFSIRLLKCAITCNDAKMYIKYQTQPWTCCHALWRLAFCVVKPWNTSIFNKRNSYKLNSSAFNGFACRCQSVTWGFGGLIWKHIGIGLWQINDGFLSEMWTTLLGVIFHPTLKRVSCHSYNAPCEQKKNLMKGPENFQKA